MNLKSVDYIITAKHYGGSARGYLQKMQQKIHRERGVAVTIRNLDKEPTGVPVQARIWQGQWIADCECTSASFVDPDQPLFFCFGCGNRNNNSQPRPVIFPPDRLEIERLILERPVEDMAGLTDNERAGMARAVLNVETAAGEIKPLTRSWEPGQTPDDLHAEQDEVIRNWKNKPGDSHGIQ
jgi:hypothetical protein